MVYATKGKSRDDLLINGQGNKYNRIAVFAADNFLLAYDYLSIDFEIDLSDYINGEMWYFKPGLGTYSYIGKVEKEHYLCKPPRVYDENNRDVVLVVRL